MMTDKENGDLKSIPEKEDNSEQINSEVNQMSQMELQMKKNQSMLERLTAETDDSDDSQGMKPGTMHKLRVLRYAMPKDRMV